MIEPGAVAHCMGQVQLVLCRTCRAWGWRHPRQDRLAHDGTRRQGAWASVYIAAPHYVFSVTPHLDACKDSRSRRARTGKSEQHREAPGGSSGRPSTQAQPRILVEHPSHDATPPQLITLLFTDIGVLTPSVVADEMIQRLQHR